MISRKPRQSIRGAHHGHGTERRSHTATPRQGWKGMHRAPSGIPDTSTTRHPSGRGQDSRTPPHLGIAPQPPRPAVCKDHAGNPTAGHLGRYGKHSSIYFGIVQYTSAEHSRATRHGIRQRSKQPPATPGNQYPRKTQESEKPKPKKNTRIRKIKTQENPRIRKTKTQEKPKRTANLLKINHKPKPNKNPKTHLYRIRIRIRI